MSDGDTWSELLGSPDSPYDFPMDLEEGARYEVPPPYPDLKVLKAQQTQIRRFVLHEIDVEARADEREKVRRYKVRRLVAEVESGEEIELMRMAITSAELSDAAIDKSKCTACGGNIPQGFAEMIDGLPYHSRCVDD